MTVRFRYPENEVRDADYPFITLDLIDITRSARREHRGIHRYDYVPDEPGYDQFISNGEFGTFYSEWPVPYDLTYQVTTYSRFAWQDRYIQHALMWTTPFDRMVSKILVGGDQADTVELRWSESATERRTDVISTLRSDTRDNNSKRIFRQVYGLRVESEMPPPVADAAAAAISQIFVTINVVQATS